MKIKLSKILGVKPVKKKARKLTLGLLITGLLSIVFVFVTIYGQYTGNYLISVTRRASLKGIAISETLDFNSSKDTLQIAPLTDVEDILPTHINVEEAENNDGALIHDGDYIAYTFYLRNSGEETVNLNYEIKVIDDYKNLGAATFFRVREYELVEDEFHFVSDQTYSKQITNHEVIGRVNINNFKPNDIRKFTFFVWIDGRYSNASMQGGAIKLDFVISITTAEPEDA